MTAHPTRNDGQPTGGIGHMFDSYARDWDEFYQSAGADGRSYDYRNRAEVALGLLERLLPASAELLEFGCGAGHTAARLAVAGHRMVCVDISEQMVAATRRTLAAAGQTPEVFLGTLENVPAQRGPFDGIFAMGVMDYVPQPASTIARAVELLKPGGVCLLSFSNSRTPLRWIEIPLKRATALALYAVTRRQRYRDIVLPSSRAHSARQVRAWYERAGLQVEGFEYFTFGLRFGSRWVPPLAWVRRWDAALARSSIRSMGRGFIAVGRKPT